MVADDTIKAICLEIRNEMLEEHNEDLSVEEVFDICNSQFVAGGFAMNKRISFMFSYIGTFVLKNVKDARESVKDVFSIKDKVSKEEYEAIVLEKRINNKNSLNGSNIKLVVNLEELPEDVGVTSRTVAFNSIYNEVLNIEKIKHNG